MKRLWIGVLFAFFSNLAKAAPIVVLVPGFFSSIAPGSSSGPYFSANIVNTIRTRAQVFVANGLLPFGDVEQNGEILGNELEAIARANPNQKIVLIAHSAGGFYSLHALNAHPDLPVIAVVTLSTPYNGSDFVENLSSNFPELRKIAKYLNLASLQEFRRENSLAIDARYRVPESVRWVAIGGSQPPCHLLTCAEAKNLSWVLTITQSLMPSPGDGIVTIDSALGNGVSLLRSNGQPFQMERWSDLNAALEHWEMVEPSALFHLIGVIDTGDIAFRQRQLYSEILDRLGYF